MAAVVEAFPEDEPHALTDPLPSMATVAPEDEPLAEIDWVDEVPTESEPPQDEKLQPVAPPATKSPRPTVAVQRPPARPKAPELAVAEAIGPTLREWAWTHRNVLLGAGVLLLVVGAVTIRLRRQRLEELPQIAEIGRTEGLKKLDAGEFFVAKKLLADATDAVNGLGGRFEGAESIRQGAMEAAIFADRAPEGIAEIVEERATGDPKEWPSKFAAFYKGRSVIIEAPISDVPEPNRPGSRYQINYPIHFGRGPKPDGKGRIDLTGFQLFELAQPKVDEQKLFGARYASVELDVATSEWVVTFEPRSGVFITHTKALEAIDWPSFESVEEAAP